MMMPVLSRDCPADLPEIENVMYGKLGMLRILYKEHLDFFKIKIEADEVIVLYKPKIDSNTHTHVHAQALEPFKSLLNCYMNSFCDNFWVDHAIVHVL